MGEGARVVDTGEAEFRTTVLSAVNALRQDVQNISEDLNEIKRDTHDIKQEVYPRLYNLETHKAVTEERWCKTDQAAKERRGFYWSVLGGLIVSIVTGAYIYLYG